MNKFYLCVFVCKSFNIQLLTLIDTTHRQEAIEPAIAAMHGPPPPPPSVFDIGQCTVKHCDTGGVSLVE